METSEIIVGLDIGTTKIAIMVGRKNEHGKLEILGMGKSESIGVIRGQVAKIGQTTESIKQALLEAEEKAGVKIQEVNVGIAGQHIKSLQHRESLTRNDAEKEISDEDIEELKNKIYKLVVPPGERIIDAIPQEFFVDNGDETNDPKGMPASRLEANFHIITAQSTAVENIRRAVTNAGLDVLQITLEPIASSESVLSDEEKEAGVCLIDIGGGTTDLAIFHDNILRHTAVIPFGGNIITEDIREGCSVIKKHAEILKVRFGSALASANNSNEVIAIPGIKGREPKEIAVASLAGIIQARMEEIIQQVAYEIKNSGFRNHLNAGIVVTGGGAQLRHLSQLISFITGLDTRIGYPTEHLASGSEELTSPTFSTGIGLVLKGFQYNQDRAREFNKKDNDVVEEENQHTNKRSKNLFSSWIEKGKNWIEDGLE